jgi:hypothetical protein
MGDVLDEFYTWLDVQRYLAGRLDALLATSRAQMRACEDAETWDALLAEKQATLDELGSHDWRQTFSCTATCAEALRAIGYVAAYEALTDVARENHRRLTSLEEHERQVLAVLTDTVETKRTALASVTRRLHAAKRYGAIPTAPVARFLSGSV